MYRCFMFLLMLLPTTIGIGIEQGYAQVMEGVVLNRESFEPVAGVTVINKNTGGLVFTDVNGRFMINAQGGDTIAYRHTSYIQVQQTVQFSLNNDPKTILMQPLVIKLNETTFRGLSKFQQDSVNIHEEYGHDLTKTIVAAPEGGGGYIGWLADKLTGNSKKPKEFRRLLLEDEKSKFIATRYTPSLVSVLTGYKDPDSIAIFINTYPMDYDFARQATDLEMKAWIRDNYKGYIKGK